MRDLHQPFDEQMTFRVWAWLRHEVQRIAAKHHRDESEVARFLLARGLAAYERDKELIEPEGGRKGGRAR